jgi:hypothetical protein
MCYEMTNQNNQTDRGAPVGIVNVNEDITLLALPLQGRAPSMLVPQVRLKLPGGLVPTPTHKHNDAYQSEIKEAHTRRPSTPQSPMKAKIETTQRLMMTDLVTPR